jgi:hypothetical protein
MAYVIQFDVPDDEIEKTLTERLHIISLNTTGSGLSHDDALAKFFAAIQEQLDMKASVDLRRTRPDIFEKVDSNVVQRVVRAPEDSPVIETTSRLCFVMMPFSNQFDDVYRNLISPVVRDLGLTVLRADEITTPGFVMEQIRSAIQQSRVCIADVTGSNPNVLYEVGYAEAAKKPLILLAEEASHLLLTSLRSESSSMEEIPGKGKRR